MEAGEAATEEEAAAEGPPADLKVSGSCNRGRSFPKCFLFPRGRPVIDKTGLTEFAYCTLEGYDPLAVVIRQLAPGGPRGAPPVPNAGADPGSVSIFTFVEDKWGLKLEPQKGPVDLLVIDHVERPSEN